MKDRAPPLARLTVRSRGANLLCVLLLGACSYQSSYVAPQDGRPRVIWSAHDNPGIEAAGATPSAECAAELRRLTGHVKLRTTSQSIELPDPMAQPTYRIAQAGYYLPAYQGQGPAPFAILPRLAPPLVQPPLFSPSLAIAKTVLTKSSGGIRTGGGGSGFSGLGGLKLGGGGGKDPAAILAAIFIVSVIAALPAVNIGVSAAHPESATESARATDLVGAWNDLMRTPGSPCSLYTLAPQPVPAEGGAQP